MEQARIELADAGREDLASLLDWLGGTRDLRGRVRPERHVPGPGDMGGLTDALVVALDDGGTGTALVAALGTWIAARRSRVRITVKRGDRTVELDARVKPDQVEPLLRGVLGDDKEN